MRRRTLVVALLAAACTGNIDAVSPTAASCEREAAPLRALTWREYEASVRQLFDVDVSPALASVTRPRTAGAFDVDRESLDFGSTRAAALRAMARATSELALSPSRRLETVGCDVAGGSREACLGAFIDRLVPRAFRRPLEAGERDALVALGTSDPEPWAGADLVVRAVLESPSFIFKTETGSGRPALEPHEVASRLAFAVVGHGPDDELLRAAADGSILQEDVRRAQAERLLATPDARRHFRAFFSQWYGLDQVEGLTRDAMRHPRWTASLRRDATAEALALFEGPFWEGRSLLEAWRPGRHQLSSGLAALYGLPASQVGSVDLSATPRRGGLFGTAAFLAVSTGHRDETSFVKRGVRVREMVLCSVVPSPPPGAEALQFMPGPSDSPLDIADRHQQPNCVNCHQTIDPIGKGFERYDAIGALRDAYAGGKPVPQEGAFPELDARFSDAASFAEVMASDARASECVAVRAFRWTRGRHEQDEPADSCAITTFHQRLEAHGFDVKAALVAEVAQPRFWLAPPWEAP